MFSQTLLYLKIKYQTKITCMDTKYLSQVPKNQLILCKVSEFRVLSAPQLQISFGLCWTYWFDLLWWVFFVEESRVWRTKFQSCIGVKCLWIMSLMIILVLWCHHYEFVLSLICNEQYDEHFWWNRSWTFCTSGPHGFI